LTQGGGELGLFERLLSEFLLFSVACVQVLGDLDLSSVSLLYLFSVLNLREDLLMEVLSLLQILSLFPLLSDLNLQSSPLLFLLILRFLELNLLFLKGGQFLLANLDTQRASQFASKSSGLHACFLSFDV
jgi:hypothetical protein